MTMTDVRTDTATVVLPADNLRRALAATLPVAKATNDPRYNGVVIVRAGAGFASLLDCEVGGLALAATDTFAIHAVPLAPIGGMGDADADRLHGVVLPYAYALGLVSGLKTADKRAPVTVALTGEADRPLVTITAGGLTTETPAVVHAQGVADRKGVRDIIDTVVPAPNCSRPDVRCGFSAVLLARLAASARHAVAEKTNSPVTLVQTTYSDDGRKPVTFTARDDARRFGAVLMPRLY